MGPRKARRAMAGEWGGEARTDQVRQVSGPLIPEHAAARVLGVPPPRMPASF